jgi:hypothetical protein
MTTRSILVLSLAITLPAAVSPALPQPPAAPQPTPAQPAAAPKEVSLAPRFAPGQIALYEVRTSDSKLSKDAAVRTARLEVLRTTDKGAVLRWTDYWEGKDKTVRPEPLGESDKRTAEFTVDVLVPSSGDDAVADDLSAARAELMGRSAFNDRARGMKGERLDKSIAAQRQIYSSDYLVNQALLADFGLLFNGLYLTVPADLKNSADADISMDPGMPTVKRSTTIALKTDNAEGAPRHTLRQQWSIPGERWRPWMRAYLKKTVEGAGEKITDAEITERIKDMNGIKGENAMTYDTVTGWPSALVFDKETADGSKIRRQTCHITLTDGPDPLVPLPPHDTATDEYVNWLVPLISSDKAPLRWYGRKAEDDLERVTPSQRQILLKQATATHPQHEHEPPAAAIFAGAATFAMPEDAAPPVEAAYPALSPQARTAVLRNALRIGEPWSMALFGRLLATSPDEKSLDELPLDIVEKSTPLSNAALKTSLAHIKAGSFDWALLITSYGLLKDKSLDADLRPVVFARAADVASKRLDLAEPKQKPAPGEWVYAEDYAGDRDTLALALDVLGYADGEAGLPELRRALKLTDVRPRAFATGSLLRRGEKVDPAVIESLCANPVGWRALVRQLVLAGKEDLVPESARTIEAAAKADLVNWLIYPTELGREPDAIELVKTVDSPAGIEKERYYIFKFRSDLKGFKEKGWMMGLSGPWSPDKPFTQPGGSGTFSEFEPIGARTPEAQADTIIVKIRQAWKQEAERPKKGNQQP